MGIFEELVKTGGFDNHNRIIFINDQSSGLLGFIAIHRGGFIKPVFGATRIWYYRSLPEALLDALKLSKIMSYKSALAGLEFGGAKAVIVYNPKNENKNEILRSYMKFVDTLKGNFITGADVGISITDLRLMASMSGNIVGLKGDAVEATARGVFSGLKVCLKEVFGSEDLSGRSLAIQGLGKTGSELLRLVYDESSKIFVSDLDKVRAKEIKRKFPRVELITPNKILAQNVDVFCPCALSNALTNKSIQNLKSQIVVGSANSQLQTPEVGEKLHQMGILYAPDYIVNAGGLISVVDEYQNKKYDLTRVMNKVDNIKDTLKNVIDKSKKRSLPINFIADEMARKISSGFK